MRRIAFLAATALLLPTLASAQAAKGAKPNEVDAEFKAADTNHDGFLSRAELNVRMTKMVVGGRKLDTVHATRVAGLFLSRADANNDGKVSLTENRALFGTVFTAYDLNHDGKIDAKEAATAREAAQQMRAATPR